MTSATAVKTRGRVRIAQKYSAPGDPAAHVGPSVSYPPQPASPDFAAPAAALHDQGDRESQDQRGAKENVRDPDIRPRQLQALDTGAQQNIVRTAPHTLKRPGLICVVPRKAAENAGSRYSGPTVWLTLFSEDASRTPATAAIVLQLTRLQNLNLRIRTPERRAASGLAPVAYARLPIGVCSNAYHTITARISMYTAIMGIPRKDPEVRPVIEGEKGPMNTPLATTAASPVNKRSCAEGGYQAVQAENAAKESVESADAGADDQGNDDRRDEPEVPARQQHPAHHEQNPIV